MITTAKFSLEHYEHMVEVGAFAGEYEKRVQLLEGEIVMMSPIGAPHHQAVMMLTDWSFQVVDTKRIAVSVQGPVRIPVNDSEPEPDLAWLSRRDYSTLHAEPHEVLLLVEVAESSLRLDQTQKMAIYAEAGIADYWIANLIDKQIEVYRSPTGKTYQDQKIYRDDESVSPLALPEASLLPAQILGSN